MQLYRKRHKTARRALQGLFLRLQPFNRPRYQTNATSHCTACATLEGINTPGRAQPIPDTTATPGCCTGQHRPPIIIRYIKGCRGAPCRGSMPDGVAYRRPCQRRRVSVSTCTGSARRGLDASHVWYRVSGQQSTRAGRSSWHPPPGGAVQRQGAGRAARNHWRLPPHLFSGFRPIANRGQQ